MKTLTRGLFLLVLTIGTSIVAFSQAKETRLYGAVNSQDLKRGLDGAQINIYKNGSKVNTITVDSKGKFDFNLEAGANYKIEFVYPGYVTKHLLLDTRSVTAEEEWGGEFKFDMSLFQKRDGLDVSILNKPIAKIFYSPEIGNTDYDKEYTESIKAEIERLQNELDAKLREEEEAKKSLEANYTKAIAAADKAMGSKDYLKAKQEYTRALSFKPDEAYPQKQLEEAQKLYDAAAADKQKEEDYKSAIESAEYALYENDLKKAVDEFERALTYKPGDVYARDQAKVTRDKMLQGAKAEQDYLTAIQKADAALASKDFLTAKGEYQKALEAKPNDGYATGQLQQVNSMIASDAEKEKNYIKSIERGDNAMEIKDYESAKAAFAQASEIKPNEQYPKDQIKEIEKRQAEIAQKKKEYDAAVKAGDDAFAAKNFEVAKQSYTKATQIIPEEQYPKDQLKAIEAKVVELANQQAKYDEIIKEADNRFNIKEYVAAKAEYAKALELKPTEEYPKKRLAEVTKLLDEMAKKDQEYAAAILNADNAFNAKDYLSAKIEYESAAKIKPEEKYPKDQLAIVQAKIDEARQKDANYTAAIDKGDAAFNAEDYTAAKAAYESALALKPEEKYPKERIDAIGKKLVELENANKKYEETIASADQAFEAKDYPTARKSYEAAAGMKPTEQYPKDQLKKIGDMVAAAEKQEADYTAAIAAGDKAFDEKKYDAAKTEYQKALGIKQGEEYPTKRITEIEGLVAAMAQKDQEYKDLVKAGDDALAANELPNAKSAYEKALAIKPDEAYPKQKIGEIESKLAEAAKAEENYIAAITRAEKAEKAKDLPTAKTEFEAALAIKPNEQYPKDKVAELTALLAASEKLDKDYSEAVKMGDDAFNNKEYDIAKTSFEKALGFKPNEAYPKEKIAAIEKIKADEAKAIELANQAQKQYDDLIAKADEAFGKDEFEAARKNYQEALKVKPEEAYPKDQLTKIDARVNELAAKEQAEAALKAKREQYDGFIAEADKAFNAKEYDAAIEKYKAAQGVLPEEIYPADQIAKINQLRADDAKAIELANQAKNEQYNGFIKAADDAMAASDYPTAETNYKSALDVKPEEKYPKDQISKIASMRADKEAQEKEYTSLIAAADKSFKSEDFDAAKRDYQAALGVKPNEQYPKDQLTAIDKRIADNAALAEKAKQDAAAKEVEEKYNALINSADKAFKSEDFTTAKTDYQAALGVKPGEQYPTDQIAEIDRRVAEASALAEKEKQDAAAKEKEEKYNGFIAAADKAFMSAKYDDARSNYQAALGVKPGEQYPTDQLAEIDRQQQLAAASQAKEQEEAAARELEKKYLGFIALGDKAFKSKDYESARSNYQSALEVKAGEQYPTDQLAEIDRLVKEAESLAAQKQAEEDALEKEKRYKSLIGAADKSYKSKSWEAAKKDYQSALEIKPGEQYPTDQIAEIDRVLASEIALRKTDEDYQNAISKGDAAFTTKDFNASKEQYQKALSIKPEEQYPKDRLALIEEELAKIAENDRLAAEKDKQREAKYNELIGRADKAFNGSDYRAATEQYKAALEIKPSEKYPQDQINEISKLIAAGAEKEQAEKDRQAKLASYDQEIAKADRAFATKKYKDAGDAYRAALDILPNEQYPKNQLKEIDRLLDEQKEVAVVPVPDKPRATITGKSEADIAAMMAEMQRKREQAKADRLNQTKEDLTDAESDRVAASKTRREDNNTEIEELQRESLQNTDAQKEQYRQKVESLQVYQEQVRETNEDMVASADNRRGDAYDGLKELQEEREKAFKEGDKLHVIGADKVNTKKIELDQQEADRVAASKAKRGEAYDQYKQYEQEIANTQLEGEDRRQKNVVDLSAFEKELAEQEKQRVQRSESERGSEYQDQVKLSEEIGKTKAEKDKIHYKNADELAVQQKAYADAEKNRIQSGDDARNQNYQNILDYEQEVKKNTDEKYNQYHSNNEKIKERNEAIVGYQQELASNADKKRQEYNVEYYQGEKKPRKSEEASRYPQGVTEETIEEGNSIIVKRYVVTGETLDEYEKIYYTWGGVYYKKNGQDITAEVWDKETK